LKVNAFFEGLESRRKSSRKGAWVQKVAENAGHEGNGRVLSFSPYCFLLKPVALGFVSERRGE
jgi:hypothetical protein